MSDLDVCSAGLEPFLAWLTIRFATRWDDFNVSSTRAKACSFTWLPGNWLNLVLPSTPHTLPLAVVERRNDLDIVTRNDLNIVTFARLPNQWLDVTIASPAKD